MALALTLPAEGLSQDSIHPALTPYVDFLGKQKSSAKDYILGLFRDHDIVVLCERDHREITQYDLFLSVIRDPWFLDSVGNIFTEVGTISQASEVNSFIHAENLTLDSIERAVIRFQRNCSEFVYWAKTNYAYFVRSLHDLNQTLPTEKKINLFNSDVPIDWSTIDSVGVRTLHEHLAETRDSIMASQIIQKFDQIREERGGRHKALVIMNYRHAFRHAVKGRTIPVFRNAGTFLYERYQGLFANVFVNNYALVSARSDNDVSVGAIQDGRWDAAFKAARVKDAGFAFRDSPFGRDSFDIYPINLGWTWQEEFNGFAFYLPFEDQRVVYGMPGFVDSAFAIELARRCALYGSVPGAPKWTSEDIERMRADLNERHESGAEMLDSLNAQIQKWLPHQQ